MKDNVITFISNNVKGIQTSQKRKKLFKYLKSYVATNAFVFLQKTHSPIRDEKKWEDEVRGKSFNWLYGTKKIEVINKEYDKYGRILLFEINIDDRLFVLINIC